MFWIQRRDQQTLNRGKGAPAGLSTVEQEHVPADCAPAAEMAKVCQTVDIHEVVTS